MTVSDHGVFGRLSSCQLKLPPIDHGFDHCRRRITAVEGQIGVWRADAIAE